MARMTDREARRFTYQLVAIGGGSLLFAVLTVTLFPMVLAGGPPGLPTGLILTVVAGGFAALAALFWVLAGVWHRWFFTWLQRLRRDLGDAEGWVDHFDLRETVGDAPVLTEAERFWRRPRGSVSVEQAAWQVGELLSGRWTVRSRILLAAYPRSACVVGPQGSGKSQFLIPRIIDAPGPAVVTSTKTELIEATALLRAQRRGPVFVFDPLNMAQGLHNHPFDPVWGCAWVDAEHRRRAQLHPADLADDELPDNEYADVIAMAMIRGASISKKMNEEFWADIGREILRCYLFAADLIGEGSPKVQAWVHDPDDPEPVDILTQAGDLVPGGWLSLLKQRLGTNTRQRDGYFATVSSCLDYLAHPGGRLACRPPGMDTHSDIANLLDSRSTLYIIGDKSKRGMASLMTALTESIYYRSRQHARDRGGRLAEPLAMYLDEVANLTPVDLPTWLSETRGWGIMVVPVIQAHAQLAKVWGEHEADEIFENCVTKVILGSLGNERFLESLSRLGGERRVAVTSDNTRHGQSATHRLERVIPLAVIRSLPANTAYVLSYARHPAVVRYEPGWQRLEREQLGLPWHPFWPRWWREPRRAIVRALELDRGHR